MNGGDPNNQRREAFRKRVEVQGQHGPLTVDLPAVPRADYGVLMGEDTRVVAIGCEVLSERLRQFELWGEQNHIPWKWLSILGEEFGEVAKAINEDDWKGYRTELIQVAAVAQAAVESFDANVRGKL